MKIAQAVLNVFVVNAFAFSADWAWGLPLIVLTVVIHVVGFGRQPESRSCRQPIDRTPSPQVRVRDAHGRHDLVSHLPSRDRGNHLGCSVSVSGGFARLQIRGALLAERDDKLRSHESIPGRALATPGSAGSAKWVAIVRADRRISIRRDSEGLDIGRQRRTRRLVDLTAACLRSRGPHLASRQPDEFSGPRLTPDQVFVRPDCRDRSGDRSEHWRRRA